MNVGAGFCECGCGGLTVVSACTDRHHGWKRGEPRRFIAGHNNRLRRMGWREEDRGFATPCHVHLGYLSDSGYAQCGGKPAYRRRWIANHGPVPDGMELDHLCRQRDCVNPDHLEPVTHKENMVRGYLDNMRERSSASPIFRARERLGLSQADVGERLGVSRSMVGLWERGKVPVPDELDVESLTWKRPYGAQEIALRRELVARHYLAGVPLDVIARDAGVSRGTVTNDVRALRASGVRLPLRNRAFAEQPIQVEAPEWR